MSKRFFNVVVISDKVTSVRQVSTNNGAMFNAHQVEKYVFNELVEANKQSGSKEPIGKVLVSHWNEFATESDFKDFIEGKEAPFGE